MLHLRPNYKLQNLKYGAHSKNQMHNDIIQTNYNKPTDQNINPKIKSKLKFTIDHTETSGRNRKKIFLSKQKLKNKIKLRFL